MNQAFQFQIQSAASCNFQLVWEGFSIVLRKVFNCFELIIHNAMWLCNNYEWIMKNNE